MSRSKRFSAPVTGRQAERCGRCKHMRRWHRNPADGVHICSVCSSYDYFHQFVEPVKE